MERCIDDELPFEIPGSWEWVRLGSVLEIARGGSPRPIQQYLTTDPDGINWIKIGDTDKGKKVRGYRVFREVCASQVSFEFFYHSERPPFTMILYRVLFTVP